MSKHIFFLGIKGIGMANLARIYHQLGNTIYGWDNDKPYISDVVLSTFDYTKVKQNLPESIDLIVYSASHGGTNHPLVQEGIQKGVKILHQVDLIANLESKFRHVVAVSGCHGKTTTTGMLSYTLTKLNQSPSYFIGVSTCMDIFGGNFDQTKYFIEEADEYGIMPPTNKTPKLLTLNPNHAIVTNIDFDHPDVYDSIDDVVATFTKFLDKLVQRDGDCIVCGDDPKLLEIINKYPKKYWKTYGFGIQNDFVVKGIKTTKYGTSFRVNNFSYQTKLFGVKNALNSTSVIAQLLRFGFHPDEIANSMKLFSGVARRFECIFQHHDTYLFDDYAHHPQEIRSTLQATQTRFPNHRIILIFQPHTYSRTKILAQEFIDSLSKADICYILPVFGSAREQNSTNAISSEVLVDLAQKKDVTSLIYTQKVELISLLEKQIRTGDVIITMGAGDVYMLGNQISKIIQKL